MLFDTDILIWHFRGDRTASHAIDACAEPAISIVTYMEMIQGARDRDEVRAIRALLRDLPLRIIPLSENIGHRAAIYLEEYGLRVALGIADSLIAATAVESNLPLVTGNKKHFGAIQDLRIQAFRPL